ncbi:MAG TPA: PDZ domain-containing protein [Steroidobacteraceae bacterium]
MRASPAKATMSVACAMLACKFALGQPAIAAEPEQRQERAQEDQERKLEAARKRLEEAAREVAELSMAMSADIMPRASTIISRRMPRAMLGIAIRSTYDGEGVEILSVSPGGPAAEAGLKAGDVLIELNEKSLKKDGSQTPHEKLLAIMENVDPDEKVKVRYLRDGKPATATVVARRAERFAMAPFVRELNHLPAIEFLRSPRGFGSAELVALTPKLGQYFGTDQGLLVVRAPNDSRLQLEEGDVILDIDGRVPRNVSHALQILGSYRPGEKLKMNVMRMKKRMTIDITIPEDVGGRGEGVRFRFEGPEHHVPSAPPTPGRPLPPHTETI